MEFGSIARARQAAFGLVRRQQMKLKFALLIALLGFVSEADAWQTAQPGLPAASPAQPPALHTSRTAFRIPFQHDAREVARLGAKEIRLYVSQDRGLQWFHMQSVEPQTGRFDFRAEAEGEFWFAVRTVDHQGQLHPGGNLVPGLAVVVDTRKPILRIDLAQLEPGRVSLSWAAVDDNIDPRSVQLEFSQSGIPEWQPVAVRSVASHQTSWTVPAGGTVLVRGTARDLAGNETFAQAQVQIAPAAAYDSPSGPVPVGPDVLSPVGSLPDPLTGPVFPGATPNANPLIPNPANPLPRPVIPPGPGANSFQGTQPPVAVNPVDNGMGIPGPHNPSPNTLTPGEPFGPAPATPSTTDASQWRDAFAEAIPRNRGAQQFQPSQNPGHRTVKSHLFQIDYEVNDIGPSGVAAVELFVTQNDGEKWYRYGVDEDRRSPFDVEVPDDGVYGFAMRVISGAGLTDPPPQPGQKPDIVIEVDAAPPIVQLFPFKQGQGAHSNRILVTWEAEDYKLAERPIALSWSSDPKGPWKLITDWLPNTGEYVWTVPRGIPPRLYLRVVARDAVGNMARVDTPQPVLVDLARPSARIVNVEPTGSGVQ